MKRLIAVFLLGALLCGLFGCGAPKEADAPEATTTVPVTTGELIPEGEGFRVGYGRAYITPEENLPMGGFGNSMNRIMNNVLDDTFVTCIAMTDEQDYTVLLMLVDMQRIEETFISALRQSVTEATGIPGEQIMISCSHTHSIPDLTLSSHEGIARYKILLQERFAQAAVDALKDSLPAQMYTGTVDAEGMNFVKHYQNTLDDGTVAYFGDNFGQPVLDETTTHVTEAYQAMHLLQFQREGGKDIVVANFRSHPTITGGSSNYDLSSDFIGPMRDVVELELDCHFAFIQGACGNINPRSRLLAENFSTAENHREYGTRLADYAIEGIQNHMTQAKVGLLQCEQLTFTATVNHTEDDKTFQALDVTQYHSLNGSKAALTREYAAQYGITSYYHASAIRYKATLPETVDIEIDTFSIGTSAGFFCAPGELFDLTSIEMEESSPFPMTYTVGFANGDWKYFPYGPCAQYDSYEYVYGRFVRGTAAEMMQIWNQSLQKLYDNAQ